MPVVHASSEIQREVLYLLAVGKYKQGKLQEARTQIDELLKVRFCFLV